MSGHVYESLQLPEGYREASQLHSWLQWPPESSIAEMQGSFVYLHCELLTQFRSVLQLSPCIRMFSTHCRQVQSCWFGLVVVLFHRFGLMVVLFHRLNRLSSRTSRASSLAFASLSLASSPACLAFTSSLDSPRLRSCLRGRSGGGALVAIGLGTTGHSYGSRQLPDWYRPASQSQSVLQFSPLSRIR